MTKADSLPPLDCRHHPVISFSSCSLQQKIAAARISATIPIQPHLVMRKRPDRLSTTLLLLTSLTPITHLRPPTLCAYFLILRVSDLIYSQHLATKRIPTCCRTDLHGTLTTPLSWISKVSKKRTIKVKDYSKMVKLDLRPPARRKSSSMSRTLASSELELLSPASNLAIFVWDRIQI